MRELRSGLWHWEAARPNWSAGEPWREEVSSYALDDGERLLLFDPLAPPADILELAGERRPIVVLTSPWHERDTQSLVERRPLLELPVELVLPAHGAPTDRAALERALA